ncbi:MAG: PAS domain S-box protein [Pseudomonadota bacterium]|nr:PAS domain S-box protein [Pseudomonadota bacterium]MDP1903207.1 PAS domain S-box protein [Pseudomonadota bacterium]MDP2354418.1 PAS domain S-box protein [Pseudomonadota bacterium]
MLGTLRFAQPTSLRARLLLLMLAAALPAIAALVVVALQLPAGALTQPVLLLTALATLIILAIGWQIGAAYLMDTLLPVVATVQRVAEGDLSARTQPERSRDDKISKLAHEVDRMAEALSRRDRALTEARDRAQAYLDVVGVMVLVLNSKGNIALANRKVCEMLGCGQLHQCLGGNWFDKWIPAEDREQARASFARNLAGTESPVEFHEGHILTASGQRRLIAWHVSPLSDTAGHAIGLLCAGEDITEKRRTEQALLDSRDRYQALVENIPGVVYRCAVAYPWRMEFINRQIEQITGIAAERFLDHSVCYGELVHPDDLAAVEQAVAAGVAHRHAYACAYRIRRNGGTWRWVHEQGQAIRDAEGHPAWLDGVIVDITENKALQQEQERLQAQLQQAQKMEALGQLTGGIAHDFNNILAAVLGFAKLALRRHAPDPNSELAEYLREVVTAGERARDLVARMLTFSRSQPGRVAQPLAAQPLIKEAMKMLTATIPAGIRIDTHIDGKAPDIAIDPVDLHQILVNLAINARDALDGKGRITISLARTQVGQQVCTTCHEKFTGEYLELTVADDGQGIAPEVLPHIFEPFFTTKAVGQGTGMGLVMVHGLVHRAGGHFQVESSVGQGSAFHIFLPVVLPGVGKAAPAQATPLGAAIDKPKGHVLIVDDETAILKLLCGCLEAMGWRVSGFASPRQALAVFRDALDDFVAVISDQTMPGMTGGDLIRSIHELRPHLPAILCTGYSDGLDEATARQQGIRRLLLKPVDGDELLAALEQAVTEEKNP